jgi:transposase-like protein
MEKLSLSAIEFTKRFGSEEQCEAMLEKLRWPKGFVCPECGHDDGCRLSGRRQIQCALCRYQASVTAGTIFHKTHLPLSCWFWIIYQISNDKGGASATRLASQLNRPYKTVWHVLQKLRHAMGRRDESITLAGLIELDEAILGPEARRPTAEDKDLVKKAPGRKSVKKPWGLVPKDGRKRKTIVEVLIMVEAERFHAGNLVMKLLPVKNFDSLREVIEKRVDEDQWFRTDAHHTHWVLRQLSRNFNIVKSRDAEGPEALPCAHRVISLLKHFLMGTYYGVSAKYLPSYLNEFCFRFMRRENESSLYASLLRACLFALPMSYAELKL